MLRIFIADNHAVVRRGLRLILQDEYSAVYIDEGMTTETLISKAKNEPWDIIIMDISMPGRSTLEALQEIKLVTPSIPVLILSGFPEKQYAIPFLKSGA